MRLDKIVLLRLVTALILAVILAQAPLLSQTYKEVGKPLIRNYSAKEYKAQPQNSAIVQGPRGLIYVANNSPDMLVFDGVRWRHIALPNQLSARCLALDERGRIWVGATSDFGYLAPDANGSLQFQSLLGKANPEDREHAIIFEAYATPEGVFFISRERIFQWQDNRLQVWKARTAFIKAFETDGRVYIRQQGIGLMRVADDSLQLVHGGELFADRQIAAIFPFITGEDQRANPESMLMALGGEGLYLFDGKRLQPWNCEVNEYIKDIYLNSGTVLNDSLLALATAKGAVLFNKRGNLLQVFDKRRGLASDMVFSLTPDREGGLWLATLQGIARVNSSNPVFTVFDETAGIDGVVSDEIIRHRGTLYIRTTNGVKYLNPRNSRFEPVDGLTQPDWSPFQYDGDLFAIKESLRKIDGHTSTLVAPLRTTVMRIFHSKIDPEKFFIETLNDGFKILQQKSGKWQVHDLLPGNYGTVLSLAEETSGDLWLGSHDGVIRLRLSSNSKTADIERFGVEHGLPKGFIFAFTTSAHPVFTSEKGLFRFEESSQRFIPDSAFGPLLADGSRSVDLVVEDSKRNIWLTVWEGGNCYLNVARRRKDDTFLYERTPFLRVPSSGIWTIFPEDDGIVWFGGEEGLMRYDDTIGREYAVDFPALVRQVIVNGDSVIYGGTTGANEQPFVRKLPYAENALRFECAATSFAEPSANRFQYFLEGFDEDWSGWTTEAQKDYTNIPEGNYTFRARAQNVSGHVSSEDSFSFTVLPPWFRTWWAYSLYACFIALTLYGLRGYEKNRQQLQHEAELHRVETEKLQEVDHLKSRFFANISHEFRTPLTLIMGQIDALQSEETEDRKQAKLAMTLRNAQKLLILINQLLDLSKFEAGQMTLRASQQNIVPLLKHLVSSFESWAAQKKITLPFETSHDAILLWYEQDKIETVIYNLLSNALKFTPEGGRISVQLSVSSDQSQQLITENSLLITVRDSGIGIPPDRLPHIFDRFFQVDSSQTREYEGTGIGLALAQELVQIHGGGISVQSTEGFGTTFVVSLPLGKDHLKPEQTVETVSSRSKAEIPTVRDDQLSVDSEQAIGSDFQLNFSKERSGQGASEQAFIPSIHQSNNSAIQEQTTSGQPPATSSDFILIVEDNADMRAFISESLQDGYRIVEAANGEEGFIKAQEYLPDLIITDVMMPRADGHEMTRRIRQDQITCHIPIIMLTAKAADEDKFEGLEKGVDAYLTKPFNKKELNIRVRKLIELRRQLRQQVGTKAVLTPAKIEASSLDQQFLQRIQEIIEENLENEDFSVDDLAAKAGVGQRQLQRKLKALTDSSPQQCIRTMRLQRARQLLEQGAGTVSEIAFRICYGTVAAFSEAFREEFGEPPSAVKPKKAK